MNLCLCATWRNFLEGPMGKGRCDFNHTECDSIIHGVIQSNMV